MKFFQEIHYDIIIYGAGPIGLSVAALLHQNGILSKRIALIDVNNTTNNVIVDDPRSIALAYFSQQVLQKIGAWKYMITTATEIHEIHISRCKHFGRILIRSEEYKLPALGYVVRYNVLIKALTVIITTLKIVRLGYAQIAMIEEHEKYASVYLVDGRKINTTIVIQAEGKICAQEKFRQLQYDYNQVAIVSYVQTSSTTILHRAFERFTAEGPLALLPEVNGYAIVWCMHSTTANRLLESNSLYFLQALKKVIGSRVGHLYNLGARSSYVLNLNIKSYLSRKRVIAIGNATQILHPVAGQGFNLGLRDALVLSKLLTSDNNLFNPRILLEFSQKRYYDRNITRYLTDLMARAFITSSPDGACSQTLLGLSLGLIDLISPFKRILVEQMIFGWR